MPLDDSWLRDTGPTFVVDGRGGVAGVDWRFNSWGERFLPYDKDAMVAERLLGQLDVERYAAPLVLEGGSIHVDGAGTLLTIEEGLLNPNRNPGLDRAAIESLLRGHLVAEAFVWLGQGLDKDETDGHVDNIACFVEPGVVMAVTCDDPADPNHAILADNLVRLKKARDARGRALEVIELTQPREASHLDGERPALSYGNYYTHNGGNDTPLFDDANDEKARHTIARDLPAAPDAQGPGRAHPPPPRDPRRQPGAAEEGARPQGAGAGGHRAAAAARGAPS